MSQDRKFVIPEEYRVKFQSCFDTMNDKCPLMCWNAGLEYDVNSGEFFIENAKNVLLSLKNYILEALKVCHGEIFGKTVLNEKKRLTEADEASKNLAVESLKAISETLDMLKQNVLTAQDKIKLLSQQGIVAQKLSGLSAQVAASIIDISECITDVTAEQTTKDILKLNQLKILY